MDAANYIVRIDYRHQLRGHVRAHPQYIAWGYHYYPTIR